jgi:hypothetical protein
MKKSSLFLLSFLCLGLSSAFSKDLKFPEEGKTLFTISIPDSWSPEFDDEGTLEAEDKNGHSYIAVWEEDTDTELAKIAEDIDEILDEYAKDVKLAGKPEPYNKLAGMPGLWIKGTAKDKEDGSGIGFEAIIVAIDKDSAAVIYFDYSQDAPEAVVKNLVKILESVTLAK